MQRDSKLKPPVFLIVTAMLIIITGFCILVFTEIGLLSKQATQIYMVILFSHASFQNIALLIKTKNLNFIPFVFLYLIVVIANVTALSCYDVRLLILFSALTIPFVIWVVYVLVMKKISYRSRQVLELAAKPVIENADGFTSRPYPIGNSKVSRETIIQFTRFLTKNLIALEYFEDDRIYLVIEPNEWAYAKLCKPKFENKTYISFDNSGHIAVNIAKKDYNKYKAELTFNQLCESLGGLFRTFLDHFSGGRPEHIIDEFNKVNK